MFAYYAHTLSCVSWSFCAVHILTKRAADLDPWQMWVDLRFLKDVPTCLTHHSFRPRPQGLMQKWCHLVFWRNPTWMHLVMRARHTCASWIACLPRRRCRLGLGCRKGNLCCIFILVGSMFSNWFDLKFTPAHVFHQVDNHITLHMFSTRWTTTLPCTCFPPGGQPHYPCAGSRGWMQRTIGDCSAKIGQV